MRRRINHINARAAAFRAAEGHYELLGWYGAFSFLLGYALTSFGIVAGDSYTYLALNISSAFSFMLFAHRRKVYQSALVNAIWLAISLITVINILT